MLPQAAQGVLGVGVPCRRRRHARALVAIDDDGAHARSRRARLSRRAGRRVRAPVGALAEVRPAARSFSTRCSRGRRATCCAPSWATTRGRRRDGGARPARREGRPRVLDIGGSARDRVPRRRRPGDPGLITRRGAELLPAPTSSSTTASLTRAARSRPAGAERVDVGKAPGRVAMTRTTSTRCSSRTGRGRAEVVRLKGGDPFVFGRGGEEAEACIAAGVPFEVVPGITSAIAAPAYAGIPVTHRGLSTSVTIVTGHEDPAKGTTDTDWYASRGRAAPSSSSWAPAGSRRSRGARSPAAARRPRPSPRCGGARVPSSAPSAPRSATIAGGRASSRRARSSSARSPRSTSVGSSAGRSSAVGSWSPARANRRASCGPGSRSSAPR